MPPLDNKEKMGRPSAGQRDYFQHVRRKNRLAGYYKESYLALSWTSVRKGIKRRPDFVVGLNGETIFRVCLTGLRNLSRMGGIVKGRQSGAGA